MEFGPKLEDYPNLPRMAGAVISADKTLIGALNSTLSLEDLYDLHEILVVDGHNARVMREHAAKDEN